MTAITGHDAAIAQFLTAMRGPRPPHGWIFAGPEGLGKASIAKLLAARLLAEAADPGFARSADPLPVDHPTARLIAAHSHPDFKLVEREVWQKGSNRDRLVAYDERKPDDLPSRSIRVVQIRWLIEGMGFSPALSSRRIVVIDAADDLETGGANALLKMLEEPPQSTMFILVSHAPGRLLPTIRSRCRVLRFAPLADDIMTSILRAHLPAAEAGEITTLAALGKGAPGRALALAGLDIAGMTQTLARIATSGDPDNRDRSALAASLALKAAQPRYEAFLRLVPQFMAETAQQRSGRMLGDGIAQWEKARELAGSAVSGSLDPQAVALSLAGLVAALAPTHEGVKA